MFSQVVCGGCEGDEGVNTWVYCDRYNWNSKLWDDFDGVRLKIERCRGSGIQVKD